MGQSDKTGTTRKIMKTIGQLFTAISCGLLLTSLSSSAQALDEARWYDVELIIFTHNSTGAGSTEQWSDDPGSPDLEGALRLSSPAASQVETPIVAEEIGLPTTRYTPLPENAWRLTNELRRLKKTHGRVMPLIHRAWRQQVRSRRNTPPLYLVSSDQIASETAVIEGAVQVSVQRYLHLNFDLILREARDISRAGDAGAYGQQSIYKNYRITNHRKMRSGELHFIDHPKVGVLILVSKYQVPEVETLAPELESEPRVEVDTTEPASAVTTAVETPATQ